MQWQLSQINIYPDSSVPGYRPRLLHLVPFREHVLFIAVHPYSTGN